MKVVRCPWLPGDTNRRHIWRKTFCLLPRDKTRTVSGGVLEHRVLMCLLERIKWRLDKVFLWTTDNWWIYVSHIHWVVWGTGTLQDRDKVNRREFWVNDGWVCDLEDISVPSIFNIIRSPATLVRMWPTFDLSCEENVPRWKWKLVCSPRMTSRTHPHGHSPHLSSSVTSTMVPTWGERMIPILVPPSRLRTSWLTTVYHDHYRRQRETYWDDTEMSPGLSVLLCHLCRCTYSNPYGVTTLGLWL